MAFSIAELETRLTEPHLLDNNVPLAHDAQLLFDSAMAHLERGDIRAARCDEHGTWHAVSWVKRAILLGFRIGHVQTMPGVAPFSFLDKHTYPTREFRPEHQVRIVPGGSTVRRGAYLAAANRAQSAVNEFQQAPAVEEALYIMVQSYEKLQLPELRDAAERVLKRNFPDSAFPRQGFATRDRPWWKLW
jgi:hypothetical protein